MSACGGEVMELIGQCFPPIIPELERPRQEDGFKLEASLQREILTREKKSKN